MRRLRRYVRRAHLYATELWRRAPRARKKVVDSGVGDGDDGVEEDLDCIEHGHPKDEPPGEAEVDGVVFEWPAVEIRAEAVGSVVNELRGVDADADQAERRHVLAADAVPLRVLPLEETEDVLIIQNP